MLWYVCARDVYMQIQVLYQNFSVFSVLVFQIVMLGSLFNNTGFIGDVPIMLAKPQTFMNSSGESVSKLSEWFPRDGFPHDGLSQLFCGFYDN